MKSLDELRDLVEGFLGELALAPELGELEEPVRYALEGGGKRVRPVLCLACGEATGASVDDLLPAAAAVELVHTFSLVHDDLPALDDDATRRGRPSVHAQFGEATAILAGDALLAEAFRLAVASPASGVARELAAATLAMIGGQQLDLSGALDDLTGVNRLKTGRLFEAAVGCALWAAGVPEHAQVPWRTFGQEVGLLFQIVDDILDGDGYAERYGVDGARARADEAASRALTALSELEADTTVLEDMVAGVSARTS